MFSILAFVFPLLKINRKTDQTVAIFGINRKFPCIDNIKKSKRNPLKYSFLSPPLFQGIFYLPLSIKMKRGVNVLLPSCHGLCKNRILGQFVMGHGYLCNYQGPVIAKFSTSACWIKGCISKFPSSNLHLLGNWDAHVRKTLCFYLQV